MVHSRTPLSSGATEMGQADSCHWEVSADCKAWFTVALFSPQVLQKLDMLIPVIGMS